jgi:hypothetical protein
LPKLKENSIYKSGIRFAADKSSVTLLTDPPFLAKHQLSEKGSWIIVIPTLPNVLSDLQNPADKISVKEAEIKILQDEVIALTSWAITWFPQLLE